VAWLVGWLLQLHGCYFCWPGSLLVERVDVAVTDVCLCGAGRLTARQEADA
jgi:hypothetical protein